jgi:zinc protease
MSHASTQSAGVRRIPFEEFDLANGLHVILSESHSSPLVAINLWYHVGSKDEDPSRTGFAHLFEHMMFQGSKHVPKAGHFKYIQEAGGTLNGTTNCDRTNYYETLPSSQLELGLWLESDRMMSLNVTEDNFENQRAVVKEERRQRYENQPYGLVWEHLLERIYPTSGYQWPTIGSMQHLDETVMEEVRQFHQSFYVPNNASLAIVGSFDRTKIRAQIESYFGAIPRGTAVQRHDQSVKPLAGQIRHTMTDAVELPGLFITFQGTRAYQPDDYALSLLTKILTSGKSSRLYRSLVYERQLAKDLSSFNMANEQAGLVAVTATTQLGITAEALEAAIWIELDRVKQEGVTDEELDKVKNRSIANHVRSTQEFAQRADHFQRAWMFKRDTNTANTELDRLLDVTREEVRSAAARYLDAARSVVLYCLPRS